MFDRRNHQELSFAEVFLAGGLAGSTAWSVVFPFDSVKSRMQVGSQTNEYATPRKTDASQPPLRAQSMLHVARTLYGEGGLPSFYRGWSAGVLRAFPANAALFVGVEATNKLFRVVSADSCDDL